MTTPANELYFNKAEKRIIKQFQKPVSRQKAEAHKKDKYQFLFYYSLIGFYDEAHQSYCLNNKGKQYLAYQEEKRRDFLKSFFSQFLSGFVVGVLVTVVGGIILNRLT